MLNKFPLWKNLLVIVVILLSTFYALPNLFGEDPAVQVSGKKGVEVVQSVVTDLEKKLADSSIKVKKSELEKGQLLMRFFNETDQLKAKELISDTLGEGYSVAINLASSTPKFMSAVGAGPLKLGLDLRGGVHFLEEIDMNTAMSKAREQLVQDCRSILKDNKIRRAWCAVRGL